MNNNVKTVQRQPLTAREIFMRYGAGIALALLLLINICITPQLPVPEHAVADRASGDASAVHGHWHDAGHLLRRYRHFHRLDDGLCGLYRGQGHHFGRQLLAVHHTGPHCLRSGGRFQRFPHRQMQGAAGHPHAGHADRHARRDGDAGPVQRLPPRPQDALPRGQSAGVYRFPGDARVPIQLVFFIAVIIIGIILVQKTVLGKRIEAIGGNERAARLSGINTVRVITIVYVLSAVFAACCGILTMCRNAALDPNELGTNYEMDAIAAVAVGRHVHEGRQGQRHRRHHGLRHHDPHRHDRQHERPALRGRQHHQGHRHHRGPSRSSAKRMSKEGGRHE